MNHFACSSMKPKNIRFTVQIDNYSKYACKGYYTSPEFSSDEHSESDWSLLVSVYDGADHENFIDVQLKRGYYVTEVQHVKAKISIVNCLGWNVLKKEKKIVFYGSNATSILTVAKEQLQGYFGLKKNFHLPADTLTLQCDLTTYEIESYISPYIKEDGLNSTSCDKKKFLERFTHSRLVNDKNDCFTWKIRDFSIHVYGGHCVSPLFESEHFEGMWSLAVYNTTDDYYGKTMDIRLARRESYEQQMVKAKLSILGRSGNILKFKEKDIYFTSPKEVPMLSLTEKDISGWFGLKKKPLMPDDELTLRCEIASYKQIDDNFGRKEDFDNRVGYSPLQLLSYLMVACLILSAIYSICTFLFHVVLQLVYILCLDMLLFVQGIVEYIVFTIIYFISSVIALRACFAYVKDKAEKIKRDEEAWKEELEIRKQIETASTKYINVDQYYPENGDYYQRVQYRKPKYYIVTDNKNYPVNRNHYQRGQYRKPKYLKN